MPTSDIYRLLDSKGVNIHYYPMANVTAVSLGDDLIIINPDKVDRAEEPEVISRTD